MENVLENKLRAFVTSQLATDVSGHDHQHAFRVVKNAKCILQEEEGNEKVVLTAAYLHDCIDKKLFSDVESQKKITIQFLSQLAYSEAEISEIIYIMDNISFSSGRSQSLTSMNAKIVCDADRLDAIGAIGIIRTIEYGASRQRKFYNGIEDIKNATLGDYDLITKESTLSHFYDKLLLLKNLMFTTMARQMAEERTAFMIQFLTQFYAEIK